MLAAFTGFWDWLRSTEAGTQARRTANVHAWTMLSVTAMVLVDIALRTLAYPDNSHAPVVVVVLSVLEALLPEVEIADLPLEVHGWTGFLDARLRSLIPCGYRRPGTVTIASPDPGGIGPKSPVEGSCHGSRCGRAHVVGAGPVDASSPGGVERCARGRAGESDMTVPTFDLFTVETGNEAVVKVVGELDLATAPRLREVLVGLSKRGASQVTVDLTQMDFIDSTGLNVLISALKRMRENGGDLALHSPSAAAMKVFEITGVTRVFTISGAPVATNGDGRTSSASSA